MPTTLYRRGRLRTPEHPTATAVVVGDDGRVAWLGDEAGADGHAGAVDAVVDLDGGLVLAGFVDAHAHVSHTGLGMRGVDLAGTRTVTEALDLVAAAARATPGAPVFAHGWQEQDWTRERAMTAAELDRASGGGVVYASRIDGHSAVASSALVAMSGADGLDGWSPSGFVVRAAKNAARAAFDAARTADARRADVELALRAAAAQGVVSVHECGGPLLTSPEDFADVLDLGRRPDLPATVGYWAESVTDPDQARALAAAHGARGLGGDLNVDGSIGSHTCLLRADYADAPGQRGTAYRSAADVRDHVAACAPAGIPSGFHVIGDAGMDLVLEGYVRAAELVGEDVVRASRPRLEHAEMVDAAGIATMARLGIGASVQPVFDAYWGGRDGMYAERLGTDRGVATNPLASFLAQGVRVAFGSDSPVTPFAPWAAVRAAVEHRDAGQRIDAATALAAHTRGGRDLAGEAGGDVRTSGPATFAVWAVAETGPDGLPVLGGGAPLPDCRLTVRDGVVLHAAS
ncbi:amidohydrolase [Phycicoccus flavus]|uniref:Amidohydrolase family protein n=1 Tax=Phycicoccus flavus TaxID=2502783 RepID=A0A8T6R682_9MICO|nr:amidohydrolase family protein [Phycicoccus flavus]NHA68335.1 amidohydrolase family protein [Phycicoccus flavus]